MHVAIIMDGNGRWAAGRGKPRVTGHQRGAERIRDVVESAPSLGVEILTLYAFSGDNWRRPAAEVSALMSLFDRYLRSEAANLRRAGVRLTVIGRRDRVPQPLVSGIAAAERLTASGSRLRLRLAIDYSSREAIRRAAQEAWTLPAWSEASFECRIGSGRGAPSDTPDVDLLIRTGGELRLSDFLLWECAYAELWFTNTAWPDFGAKEFRTAVNGFRARDRRFGALPA